MKKYYELQEFEEYPEKEVLDTNLISEADTVGDISDGYHTFNELYDHRITLYVALCRQIAGEDRATPRQVWRSRAHSDGSVWDGWFLLGVNKEPGNQVTYHLPESRWEECDFAQTLDIAPEFDGHSPSDVLERIKVL